MGHRLINTKKIKPNRLNLARWSVYRHNPFTIELQGPLGICLSVDMLPSNQSWQDHHGHRTCKKNTLLPNKKLFDKFGIPMPESYSSGVLLYSWSSRLTFLSYYRVEKSCKQHPCLFKSRRCQKKASLIHTQLAQTSKYRSNVILQTWKLNENISQA